MIQCITSGYMPPMRAIRRWHECHLHQLQRVSYPHQPSHTIYALQGVSEPRGKLAQCSVSLHAVLAASLGAHRKAQHARVCFAGGR